MADFLTAVDIANRAAQHVGVRRITAFTDDSAQASEFGFCYDKLRRAELRRNVWRFAVRRAMLRPIDNTTMELIAAGWNPSEVYSVGSIVSWQNLVYIALNNNNLNNKPGAPGSGWTQYFGPMTVTPWAATTAYYSGELVYYLNADGSYHVYLSLQTGNADSPTNIPVWDPTLLYKQGDVVQTAPTPVQFNGVNVLFNGVQVVFVGAVWESARDLNQGQMPAQGSAFWAGIPAAQTDVMQGQRWLRLDATVKSIPMIYPLGTGPSTQTTTKNVFQLPDGYLRQAPDDPKAGRLSLLGTPRGLVADDYLFEGNYLVSGSTGPIMLRFVADIADVTAMDPMFCEGLGARIGLETCERLTQSGTKLAAIGADYQKFMTDARTVNAVEVGSQEPPLDDYITCRW